MTTPTTTGFGQYSEAMVSAILPAEALPAWREPTPFASRVQRILKAGATQEQIRALGDLWDAWKSERIASYRDTLPSIPIRVR